MSLLLESGILKRQKETEENRQLALELIAEEVVVVPEPADLQKMQVVLQVPNENWCNE